MNTAALLSLIADLYQQVRELQAQVESLQKDE